MEANSGLYTYYDMNLWSAPAARAALATRAASVTTQDAKAIADAFLTQNKLMPTDAVFYEVTTDKLTPTSALTGAASAQASDTVYQVIYSRVLPTTYINAAGAQAQSNFLVVGPGAKLKVYVPINPPVTAVWHKRPSPTAGFRGPGRLAHRAATDQRARARTRSPRCPSSPRIR